jgi:predicted lysophospholipase L1 biosynthesis ABC-type transport system permease subunit
MSGCLRKIHAGPILLATVTSVVIGLVIGFFWIRSLDMSACMAGMVPPDSGNPLADLFAGMMEILAVGVACVILRMMAFVPLYLALSVVICALIVLMRVREARLLNIVLAVILAAVLGFVALAVLAAILKL